MKISKFIFALSICVLIFIFNSLSAVLADPVPKFQSFPTLGRCTGNSVRLREDPSTESEILGRLNTGDCAVVLDKFVTDGNTWYEVDNPFDEGSAFMFGKYLEPVYLEEHQVNPLHKLIMNLYLTFGITPEKAEKLSGKPKSKNREVIGADSFERINMDYGNFSLEYLANSLTSVRVQKGKKPFGDIKIGSDASELIEVFGEPNQKDENLYSYQDGEMTFITFELKNQKVSSMGYQVYYDIEE
ncbi:MAG: SH3 domain-containing protein [Synergistaceae bacterium]|nr:SH3 domain-containing protein [Synergistaceae bacterium]